VITVTATTADGTVEISIADNGPGLPADEQEVLSKGVETSLIHGSGLGLWMVYWIVDTHDGTIETTVTPEGTTISVTLPQIPDGTATTGQDVRTLERGRDRFEAVFEESFNAMVILDDDQRIIDINKYAANLLGNDGRETLGRQVAEFTAPSFDFGALWDDLHASGKTEGEASIISDDGTEYIFEYRAVADIIPGQHLIVGQDITERKTREQALEESKRRYQTLAENFPNGAVSVFDSELCYQSAHGKGFEEVGLDAAELEGNHISEFFHGEQLAEQRAMYEATLDGEPQDGEFCYGGRFYEVYTVPIRDDTGEVYAGHVMTQDVTERERREQKLAEAQTAFENTQDAMFLIDVTDGEEFTIQRVNEVYESMTGISNEEIQGKTPVEAVGEEIGETIEAQYQECVERREMIEYPEEIPVDGEMRHWQTKLTPIIDDGTVVKLVGAMRDVTEQKAREAELNEAIRDLETILDG
jgi:PAS domain S-box-containing protein